VERRRQGRCNVYRIHPELELGDPIVEEHLHLGAVATDRQERERRRGCDGSFGSAARAPLAEAVPPPASRGPSP
jgi:hypothetical protein